MTLTTTWPGIILGLHESTIVKDALKSIGCKSYYYRVENRIGLTMYGRKIELFFSGIDGITAGPEKVVFRLTEGREVVVTREGIIGEGMVMLYPEPEKDVEEEELEEEESAWITIPQAVHIIGCNKSSIYRWINNGKLEHQGRRVRKADVLGLAEGSRKIKKDS